jgi:hypothetical protein
LVAGLSDTPTPRAFNHPAAIHHTAASSLNSSTNRDGETTKVESERKIYAIGIPL